MSWADIKRRYETSGGSASQSTEDMVARRILRALGATEGGLPHMERELGLARRADDTLLERAVALARLMRDTVWRVPPIMDVRTVKAAEDALLDLVDGADVKADTAVVYRKTGERGIHAMIWLGKPDAIVASTLPVPCRILRCRDGETLVVDCDVGDYIAKKIGGP